jgi:hypothetical protein
MKINILTTLVAGILGAPLVASAQLAQIVIDPGGERTISTFGNAGVACRVGNANRQCGFVQGFNGTEVDVSESKVATHSRHFVTGTPFIPRYAQATLFRVIRIDGPPNTHVLAAISAIFDYNNFFTGAAAYSAGSSLSFTIRDRKTGKLVASQSLFEREMDGSQGFTDVAAAQQRHVLSNSVGNMLVLLRRGRDYAIRFELESMVQGSVGVANSRANATLKSITVRVDEDEQGDLAQQLAEHDQAIRLQLAEHDSIIRDELATHDIDIKKLLQDILANQDDLKAAQHEIIRLLNTPQGQRNSTYDACDGGPCKWPDKRGK